jgi:hypothetical protein
MIFPKIYALLAISVMGSLPAAAQDHPAADKGTRMRKVSDGDRRLPGASSGKNVRITSWQQALRAGETTTTSTKCDTLARSLAIIGFWLLNHAITNMLFSSHYLGGCSKTCEGTTQFIVNSDVMTFTEHLATARLDYGCDLASIHSDEENMEAYSAIRGVTSTVNLFSLAACAPTQESMQWAQAVRFGTGVMVLIGRMHTKTLALGFPKAAISGFVSV